MDVDVQAEFKHPSVNVNRSISTGHYEGGHDQLSRGTGPLFAPV